MMRARVIADFGDRVAAIDRRVFGSFVEHLGRCVYDGIYEPGHPTADADGFRQDVLELVRELGVTTVRYPGGNFVSGYRWEDGVGPRAERPRRLDLAWHSTETNEVGLDEFARWSQKAGTELMLAVNLGTRGTLEAVELVEYANLAEGTTRAQERIANGGVEPYGVKVWCLGNEMDGPWQLGHRSADDYGKLAAQTARALKQVDESLELVVCGSSSAEMPTFGSWERTVLRHSYDSVEFISCHAYYDEKPGDPGSFLASATNMDHFIETVAAAADEVKAELGSDRTIDISFDEWNVWYIDRYHDEDKIVDPQHWPVAPRLLEDSYTVTDGVVVGNLLISLLRHADRVRAASLAQLVNVIAPIMTEPAGPAWRQTTFFPFATTADLATGDVLATAVECDRYDTAQYGSVPLVDAVVTTDGERVSVFLVNRSLEEEVTVTVELRGAHVAALDSAQTLADADRLARNTLDDRERVGLTSNDSAAIVDGALVVTLPPVSWTAVSAR
ncbi:MAG: alpha-N-arabinofuranosidase [Actinomycetales bacterium]|nr:alpha-N-arabinofuranosidase [Actinomycetales bacterium]